MRGSGPRCGGRRRLPTLHPPLLTPSSPQLIPSCHNSCRTLSDRWAKVGAKIGGSGAGLSDVVAQRQGRSTKQHYHTLDLPALCRLPIGELAAKDAGLAIWVYGPPIHWR